METRTETPRVLGTIFGARDDRKSADLLDPFFIINEATPHSV